MRHSRRWALLALFVVPCGCTAEKGVETASHSRQPERPSYSGKVEAVRDGKVTAFRECAYGPEDIVISPSRFSGFAAIPNGEAVAVLRVYWPTYGLEETLKKSFEKSETTGPLRLETTLTMQSTSDYHLTKNQGRYSLTPRGHAKGAEHFGYFAKNDDDAVEIALDYVSRFVGPIEIGAFLHGAGPDWREKVAHLSN